MESGRVLTPETSGANTLVGRAALLYSSRVIKNSGCYPAHLAATAQKGREILQSTVELEGRQESFGSCSGDNKFKAARGDSMGLTNNREQNSSLLKRSVLGDVRSISQRSGADGRDIIEIEHTDGTETILAFDKVS